MADHVTLVDFTIGDAVAISPDRPELSPAALAELQRLLTKASDAPSIWGNVIFQQPTLDLTAERIEALMRLYRASAPRPIAEPTPPFPFGLYPHGAVKISDSSP